MRVDEARHHDLVGGVDHLVGGRAKIAADRFDPVAAEQSSPFLKSPTLGSSVTSQPQRISTRFMKPFPLQMFASTASLRSPMPGDPSFCEENGPPGQARG